MNDNRKKYKVRVKHFDGTIGEYDIDHIWFWKGRPERVYTQDDKGVLNGKFKFDEEPFEIFEVEE